MHFNPFYSNYSAFVKAKDPVMVKDIVTSEIADAVVDRKEDVIDKLNHSGLYVDSSVTTKQLSAIVSENLSNPKFVKGITSIIIGKNPKDLDIYLNASGSDRPIKDKNGKKVIRKRPTEIDYFNDMFIAVNGSVQKGDADVMDKVDAISTDDTEKKESTSKGNYVLLGIAGTCALAVYLIGVKKIV